jgi:hypothetical protein
VEELKALFEELGGIYRVMVYVGGVTGLRVSEVIGLLRSDCDFKVGKIRLKRGWVRRRETEMKTEASRKPIPLEAGLAEVLLGWRAECAYNQPDDYIFASIEMDGEQPLWPNRGQWRTTSVLRRCELGSQSAAYAQLAGILATGRVCTNGNRGEGMRKAITKWEPEQGTQTPSPAPDLIPSSNPTSTENSHSFWYSKWGHFRATNPRRSIDPA